MLKKCCFRFQAKCRWCLRPMRCAPCENLSFWVINGALCRAHLSLHWGTSWCNHKRDVFMNGALTDECELPTTKEHRKELSPHPYWPGMIYHSDGSGSLAHVSSVYIQSHKKSPCTGTQRFILYALGSWSVSGRGDWCWGVTMIRETREGSLPVVSGFLSGHWSTLTLENGLWGHEHL